MLCVNIQNSRKGFLLLSFFSFRVLRLRVHNGFKSIGGLMELTINSCIVSKHSSFKGADAFLIKSFHYCRR